MTIPLHVPIEVQYVSEQLGEQTAYKLCLKRGRIVVQIKVAISSQDTTDDKHRKAANAIEMAVSALYEKHPTPGAVIHTV